MQNNPSFKTPKIAVSHSYNHIKNNNSQNQNLIQNNQNPPNLENNNETPKVYKYKQNNFRNHNSQNYNYGGSNLTNNSNNSNTNSANSNINSNNTNNNNNNNNVIKEEDLRQTQKRGAPKVASNKLPSEFGGLQNTNKKNKQNAYFQNNPNLKQENHRVKNIDHLADIQDYQKAQNLLSPIKINEKKQKKNVQSKNPLQPMRQYLINYQKTNEEINQQDLQFERINKMINNKSHDNHNFFNSNYINNTYLLSTKLRLEEMITLGLMKGNRQTGLIKKMLHAPTLQLYSIKEEPISNKEVRNNLKDWVSFWQNKFKDSDLHIKIYGSFWNTPEGCVSILMEHLDGGSLQNLLESVGCMPERALKEISQQILGSLQILHEDLDICHGAITPSQILFNREGNVKLSLGISYRVNVQNTQFTAIGKQADRNSLYDPSVLQTPNLFNKQNQFNQTNQIKSNDNDKAEDIMKFGLMMIISAIGDLEILDNHQILMENLKLLIASYNKNPEKFQNQQVCCVVHSEQLIYQVNQESQNQVNKQPNITLYKILKNGRLSKDYLDFICCCTQLDIKKTFNIANLLRHPFIKERNLENKSPKIYLKDLIKTSSNWEKQEILPLEFQGASEKQLNRLVDALSLVLPNCDKWFTDPEYVEYVQHLSNLNPNSQQIDAIAQYLGLNNKLVLEKIISVYQNIQFSQNVQQQKRYKKQQQYN